MNLEICSFFSILSINQSTLHTCRTIETEGKRHFTNKHRLEIRTHARAYISLCLSSLCSAVHLSDKFIEIIWWVQYLFLFIVDFYVESSKVLLVVVVVSVYITTYIKFRTNMMIIHVTYCRFSTSRRRRRRKKHDKIQSMSISLVLSPLSTLVSECVDQTHKKKPQKKNKKVRMSEKKSKWIRSHLAYISKQVPSKSS